LILDFPKFLPFLGFPESYGICVKSLGVFFLWNTRRLLLSLDVQVLWFIFQFFGIHFDELMCCSASYCLRTVQSLKWFSNSKSLESFTTSGRPRLFFYFEFGLTEISSGVALVPVLQFCFIQTFLFCSLQSSVVSLLCN